MWIVIIFFHIFSLSFFTFFKNFGIITFGQVATKLSTYFRFETKEGNVSVTTVFIYVLKINSKDFSDYNQFYQESWFRALMKNGYAHSLSSDSSRSPLHNASFICSRTIWVTFLKSVEIAFISCHVPKNDNITRQNSSSSTLSCASTSSR